MVEAPLFLAAIMMRKVFIATFLYFIGSQHVFVTAWSLPRMQADSYSRRYIHWRMESSDNQQNMLAMMTLGQQLKFQSEDDYQTSHYSYKEVFQKNGLRQAPWMVPLKLLKWAYRLQLKVLPILYA